MSTPLPEAITSRFLRSLRNQFYKGQDKFYHQERNLLLMAITYPADWLHERSLKLPAKRYTEILALIIRTINQHGKLSEVRSPARYLLQCVQSHMAHHGEEYLDQAKAIDRKISDALQGLLTKRDEVAKARAADIDNTVPVLADTHRVISATLTTRRKAKAKPADTQQSLF